VAEKAAYQLSWMRQSRRSRRSPRALRRRLPRKERRLLRPRSHRKRYRLIPCRSHRKRCHPPLSRQKRHGFRIGSRACPISKLWFPKLQGRRSRNQQIQPNPTTMPRRNLQWSSNIKYSRRCRVVLILCSDSANILPASRRGHVALTNRLTAAARWFSERGCGREKRQTQRNACPLGAR